jgi:hypothetical protein
MVTTWNENEHKENIHNIQRPQRGTKILSLQIHQALAGAVSKIIQKILREYKSQGEERGYSSYSSPSTGA